MKSSKWFGMGVICLAIGSLGFVGCGDDDDGGGNSELQAAVDSACENAVGCAREAGAPISSESQICAGFEALGSTAGIDQNCVNKSKDYLNCIGDAACGDFDSCDDKNDEVTEACEVDDNNDATDGGDDGGGDDGGATTSLGQAAEAACDKAVECAGEIDENSPIGRDLICAAYSAYEISANFYGGACSSATESFLNCFASTECGSTEAPCQSEIASLQSSCAPGAN